MKAQTRSSDHPLIKAINEKMADFKKSQRALWDRIKPARARCVSMTGTKKGGISCDFSQNWKKKTD